MQKLEYDRKKMKNAKDLSGWETEIQAGKMKRNRITTDKLHNEYILQEKG